MLQTIIGYVVTAVMGVIGGWVAKMIHAWMQDRATEKQANESVDPLKKAQTGKEIDDASNGALGGF